MGRLVTIRSSRYGLDIELDQNTDFGILLDILSEKFKESARFFKDAKMALSFSGRPLSREEEDLILEIISKYTQIDILCVVEQNDKNELLYRSIVEQSLAEKEKREGTFSCKAKLTEKFAALVSIGAVGGNLFLTKRVCQKSTSMTDRAYAINRVIALQMKTGVAICVAADIPSGQKYYKRRISKQ